MAIRITIRASGTPEALFFMDYKAIGINRGFRGANEAAVFCMR